MQIVKVMRYLHGQSIVGFAATLGVHLQIRSLYDRMMKPEKVDLHG